VEKQKQQKFLLTKNIGIGALLIVVAVAVYFGMTATKKPAEAPLAKKPKECIDLLGTGKQTYDIQRDNPKSLGIVQVDVDPIDVEEGQVQIITVKVKDDGNNTITKKSGVTANIQTDNKNTAAAAFVMRFAEDSEDGFSLLTTWEGSWIRTDTSCHSYMETITATNDKGEEASVDLSFK